MKAVSRQPPQVVMVETGSPLSSTLAPAPSSSVKLRMDGACGRRRRRLCVLRGGDAAEQKSAEQDPAGPSPQRPDGSAKVGLELS